MSTPNDGGPAFPVMYETPGMSLRDYFAAHAPEMTWWFIESQRKTWYTREVVPAPELGLGYVKHEKVKHTETDEELWFRWRLYYADAMLAERAKTKGGSA